MVFGIVSMTPLLVAKCMSNRTRERMNLYPRFLLVMGPRPTSSKRGGVKAVVKQKQKSGRSRSRSRGPKAEAEQKQKALNFDPALVVPTSRYDLTVVGPTSR